MNFKVGTEVKGITLIALVITIIVLLILAGVSIAMLTGDNGILTQANNSKQTTERAEAKERAQLDVAAYVADEKANGRSGELNDSIIKGILAGKEYVEEAKDSSFISKKGNHEILYSELYGTGSSENPGGDTGEITEVEGVKIPKGFYYVGGSKDNGIVISDNEADKEKYKDNKNEVPGDGLEGNQFVWVPVENDAEFKTYEGYSNGTKQTNVSIGTATEPYVSGYPTEKEEYDKMKQSVLDNDGFYVARYEAGKENINGTDKVVSKKGETVWNRIAWGISMTNIGTSGAVYQSQQMYTDKEKYGVTSTLIYGIQWDAIMSWIDPAYKTGTCDTSTSFVANSTGKGNYSGSIKETGSSDDYRIKNIYDLAGNAWEWTMEAYGTGGRVYRGGVYEGTGSDYPASYRYYNRPNVSDNRLTFRSALYL